ncbi:hypothetical protein [Haloarcula onubensis]|uniref:Uncharacterized protein n=1 Tax=Haloarcula onubensis TaxID=2950539 RepID=A0ABU2FV78_9EURY|nr:hypothetical protein [Halomicroarcula sp. S3CR25-11]MDS0284046.1 hypothetical protein [Halomicroarcula sp. S3CR25-11]
MSQTDPPEGVDNEAIRRAMRRILQAEEDKLHMDLPRGINDEIEAIIEDEIK